MPAGICRLWLVKSSCSTMQLQVKPPWNRLLPKAEIVINYLISACNQGINSYVRMSRVLSVDHVRIHGYPRKLILPGKHINQQTNNKNTAVLEGWPCESTLVAWRSYYRGFQESWRLSEVTSWSAVNHDNYQYSTSTQQHQCNYWSWLTALQLVTSRLASTFLKTSVRLPMVVIDMGIWIPTVHILFKQGSCCFCMGHATNLPTSLSCNYQTVLLYTHLLLSNFQQV